MVKITEKQELAYFLIIYIVVELILFLGYIYHSVSGAPTAEAIERELMFRDMYLNLLIGYGIIAPIVFFAIKHYNRRKK